MDDKKQPIIVRKIRKSRHRYHCGAWRVGYSDLVTVMLAFLLLMWLLGTSSQHVREGIADWFRNPTGVQQQGRAMEILRSDRETKTPSESDNKNLIQQTGEYTQGQALQTKPKILNSETEQHEDKQRLDKLLQQLKLEIETTPALSPFKDQLLLDVTPEGLRIQIVDKKNRPMFDARSAILRPYTRKILQKLGGTINTVPNHISISGHTDAGKFISHVYVEYGSFDERRTYSNWELSADRANATRRELLAGGMRADKIGRVAGLADTMLFDESHPNAVVNRRISIIVLNRETEAEIGLPGDKSTIDRVPARTTIKTH